MRAVPSAVPRAVAAAVLVTSVLVPVLLGSAGAAAPGAVDPTTTTEPAPPTTAAIPDPGSTTTTVPASTSSTTSTTSPPSRGGRTTTSLVVSPDAGGDDGQPTDQTVPPEAQKIINAVKRSKPNDTKAVIAALSRLQAYGISARDSYILGFGHFPVAGPAHFVDDWLNPRFTPVFHMHQGTDIWADLGTPIRAPYDGVLTFLDEPVGGMDEFVTLPDKTYFFFAHLSARAKIAPGTKVHQGDVIGFVGNSGDASDGATHLHFEIHPKGGGATNPKPYLDQWLAEATANAPRLIARFAGTLPASLRATALTRGSGGGGEGGEMFAAPDVSSATDLVWVPGSSQSGALQLAAIAAARLAERASGGR